MGLEWHFTTLDWAPHYLMVISVPPSPWSSPACPSQLPCFFPSFSLSSFLCLSNLSYWLPLFPPWLSLFFLIFLSHFFLSQHPHPSCNAIFQHLPDGFSCLIMFLPVLIILGSRLHRRFLYIFHRWCVWNIFPLKPPIFFLPIPPSPKQWHL